MENCSSVNIFFFPKNETMFKASENVEDNFEKAKAFGDSLIQ
jgi:hypothetical protein